MALRKQVADVHSWCEKPMLKRTASFFVRLLASMVLISLAVAGCTTSDSPAQDSLGDLGSSLGSSLGKNTDTNGTSRRPDV